jgi:dolichol-phosphate mannosyltransferase
MLKARPVPRRPRLRTLPRGEPAPSHLPAPEISIVIPTYKERENIERLVSSLDDALPGLRWEAIFVDDDSPDGTTELIRSLGAEDGRLRCIRRIGRRGLAGACIEGMLAATAEFVVVMDADLQHDARLLPRMAEILREAKADLVVGSRYLSAGDADSLGVMRSAASRLSTTLATRLLGVKISDPMSGFFMIRRQLFDSLAPALSTQGFKVLLDILATARTEIKVVELPYSFGRRMTGQSKLDARVVLDYLGLLFSKLTGDFASPRFLPFALVGAVGVLVHLAVLKTVLSAFAEPFGEAQVLATLVAMISNFLLNNQLTYHDQRLVGWPLLHGLLGFCAVCSFGAIANYGIAVTIYEHMPVWWLAGAVGAVAGAIWNFAMSSRLVWRSY